MLLERLVHLSYSRIRLQKLCGPSLLGYGPLLESVDGHSRSWLDRCGIGKHECQPRFIVSSEFMNTFLMSLEKRGITKESLARSEFELNLLLRGSSMVVMCENQRFGSGKLTVPLHPSFSHPRSTWTSKLSTGALAWIKKILSGHRWNLRIGFGKNHRASHVVAC